MVCSLCGSTMVLGGGKYACSRARKKGTSANTKIIAATTAKARVLEGVRRHLLSPAAIKKAVEEAAERWWAEHRARLSSARRLSGSWPKWNGGSDGRRTSKSPGSWRWRR